MINTIEKPKSVVLVEDPLGTANQGFLERILRIAGSYKYLNAVQYGSVGGNFGIPSNSNEEQIGESLPGGITIRARYRTEDIRRRYSQVVKGKS